MVYGIMGLVRFAVLIGVLIYPLYRTTGYRLLSQDATARLQTGTEPLVMRGIRGTVPMLAPGG